MSQPLAHLYDLALRALDEQERRAEALRGRLGPVLAAAALSASLLSGPLVGGGERPVTLAGTLMLVVAFGGLAAALVTTHALFRVRREISSDLDVPHLITQLAREDALDEPSAFYAAMIARLGAQRSDNDAAFDRLAADFTAMLCGILLMLCGLALAAILG